MTTVVKSFQELEPGELYKILQLRASIFVVEQNCAYQDLDDKDQFALHVMGKSNNELQAYTRVFGPGSYFKDASIGRVVVGKNSRGKGYGKVIMEQSIQLIHDRFGPVKIMLSAQSYLKKFYRELGFSETGEEYLEDGIPHIKMYKN